MGCRSQKSAAGILCWNASAATFVSYHDLALRGLVGPRLARALPHRCSRWRFEDVRCRERSDRRANWSAACAVAARPHPRFYGSQPDAGRPQGECGYVSIRICGHVRGRSQNSCHNILELAESGCRYEHQRLLPQQTYAGSLVLWHVSPGHV